MLQMIIYMQERKQEGTVWFIKVLENTFFDKKNTKTSLVASFFISVSLL